MVDALGGIAATIYIFKFLIISSNRIQQSGVAHRSTVTVARGQNRSASVAMMPKSGGDPRSITKEPSPNGLAAV